MKAFDDWRTEADEDMTFGRAVFTFLTFALIVAALLGCVLLVAASMDALP